MAKATRHTVTPPAEPVYRYTLELSQREAEVLSVVLSSVGGDHDLSPRGYADKIYHALEQVGIRYRNTQAWRLIDRRHGNPIIYFRDYGSEDD